MNARNARGVDRGWTGVPVSTDNCSHVERTGTPGHPRSTLDKTPGHGVAAEHSYFGDPAEIVAASEPDPLELLRRLADLVPAWHRDAACAGEPVGIFLPGLGERNTAAMELCGRCPVRRDCLDWAIAEQINHGVYGGMSPAARRAHARGRS